MQERINDFMVERLITEDGKIYGSTCNRGRSNVERWMVDCHNEKIYGGESLILRTITDGCHGRVGHA